MKETLHSIWEIAKIVILALLIVLPIRAFVFQPFLVRGASMEPNFHNGDYLIVDQLSYQFREPERGEVIVFKFPQDPSQRYIKRIIGLPGEEIEIHDDAVIIKTASGNQVRLNESGYIPPSTDTEGGSSIELGKDEYFVLGDNRTFSSDSRKWGLLPEEEIIGRVLIRLFPPNAFATVEAPAY